MSNQSLKSKELLKEEFDKKRDEILEKLESVRRSPILEYLVAAQRDEFYKKMKWIASKVNENFNSISDVEVINLLLQQIRLIKSKHDELFKYLEENHLLKDGYEDNVIFLENNPNIKDILVEVDFLFSILSKFINLKKEFNNTLPDILKKSIAEVSEELNNFRRLRSISDNAKTEDIYNSAVDKYKKLEEKYRKNFYLTIFIVSSLSIGLLLGKVFLANFLELSIYEFWALKISVLLIGIVLITYFLKQSSHYQYLADQNYQTQIELQAFPTFMESIPTEEAASVRKELALKYFGRDIDSTPHKDMANLISDQMKNTTEMVKAATDVLKVKGKE